MPTIKELITDLANAKSQVSELVGKAEQLSSKIITIEQNVADIQLEQDISDKQDSYIDADQCDELHTSLGTIHVHNQSGNLALQQHIDTFLSSIKEKYL